MKNSKWNVQKELEKSEGYRDYESQITPEEAEYLVTLVVQVTPENGVTDIDMLRDIVLNIAVELVDVQEVPLPQTPEEADMWIEWLSGIAAGVSALLTCGRWSRPGIDWERWIRTEDYERGSTPLPII
jgi:hypothetical protein